MIICRVLFLAFFAIVSNFCVLGAAASGTSSQKSYYKERMSFAAVANAPCDTLTPEEMNILDMLSSHTKAGENGRNRLFVRLEVKFVKSDKSLESRFIPLGFFMSGWQDYSTKTKVDKIDKKRMLTVSETTGFFGATDTLHAQTFADSMKHLIEANFIHNSILYTVPVLKLNRLTYAPLTLGSAYGYADHLSWKLHFVNLISMLIPESNPTNFIDVKDRIPDTMQQQFIEDCYVFMQKKYYKEIDQFQKTIIEMEDIVSLSMDEYMRRWSELSKKECFSSSGFYKSFCCSEQAFLSFLGQKQFSDDVRQQIAAICYKDVEICGINLHLSSIYNMCPYCRFTFRELIKKDYLLSFLKKLFDVEYLYPSPTETLETTPGKKGVKKQQYTTDHMDEQSAAGAKPKNVMQLDHLKNLDVFFTYITNINRGESK